MIKCQHEIIEFSQAVTRLSNGIKRFFRNDRGAILSQVMKDPEILDSIQIIRKKMKGIFTLFNSVKAPSSKNDFKFEEQCFANQVADIKFLKGSLTYFKKYQQIMLSKYSSESIVEYYQDRSERITEIRSQLAYIKDGLKEIDQLLDRGVEGPIVSQQ